MRASTPGDGKPARPDRRRFLGLLLLAPGSALAGCGGSGGASKGASADQSTEASVTITPAAGATAVSPDQQVRVEAVGGKLTSVTLTGSGGTQVAGTLTPDGARWTSGDAILAFGGRYTVTAEAANPKGRVTRATATFSTVDPPRSQQVRTIISPLAGMTVGVGHPIAVQLTNPARDKAARERVEKRLRVAATPPVEGAWHWFDSTHLDWRPRDFWPAGTKVRLTAHLTGVDLGGGLFGGNDQDVPFTVGDAVVSTVDAAAHTMTVTRGGAVLRTLPVTTGKAGFATRNGVKVILERDQHIVMDSKTVGIPAGSPNSYHLDVSWAVRVTNSGEFLHAAPWSVGQQGSANVSHGCVGMSTPDAQWYFNLVKRGDVVRVVNSEGKGMEPSGNGYGDWNVSWPDWLAGSELGAATTAPVGQV